MQVPTLFKRYSDAIFYPVKAGCRMEIALPSERSTNFKPPPIRTSKTIQITLFGKFSPAPTARLPVLPAWDDLLHRGVIVRYLEIFNYFCIVNRHCCSRKSMNYLIVTAMIPVSIPVGTQWVSPCGGNDSEK